VLVEYLCIDMKTCDRCLDTGRTLDEVMAVVTPALELAGYRVIYEKTEITDEESAVSHRLLSSPTIRINGRDICGDVRENECGCCSEISNNEVECRVYEYMGETYEVPPGEMIAEAILKTIFKDGGNGCSCEGYELPGNLRSFFEGKNRTHPCE
jgi:hypothetical protein